MNKAKTVLNLIEANDLFALVKFEGKDEFVKMRAQKKGSRWEVGGDNPVSLTDIGATIFIVSKGKIHLLKGNRIVFQDNFVASDYKITE